MRLINKIRSKLGLRVVYRIFVSIPPMTVSYKIRAMSFYAATAEAKRRFLEGLEDMFLPEELETWGGA